MPLYNLTFIINREIRCHYPHFMNEETKVWGGYYPDEVTKGDRRQS